LRQGLSRNKEESRLIAMLQPFDAPSNQ
jgi:hypothetical protein